MPGKKGAGRSTATKTKTRPSAPPPRGGFGLPGFLDSIPAPPPSKKDRAAAAATKADDAEYEAWKKLSPFDKVSKYKGGMAAVDKIRNYEKAQAEYEKALREYQRKLQAARLKENQARVNAMLADQEAERDKKKKERDRATIGGHHFGLLGDTINDLYEAKDNYWSLDRALDTAGKAVVSGAKGLVPPLRPMLPSGGLDMRGGLGGIRTHTATGKGIEGDFGEEAPWRRPVRDIYDKGSRTVSALTNYAKGAIPTANVRMSGGLGGYHTSTDADEKAEGMVSPLRPAGESLKAIGAVTGTRIGHGLRSFYNAAAHENEPFRLAVGRDGEIALDENGNPWLVPGKDQIGEWTKAGLGGVGKTLAAGGAAVPGLFAHPIRTTEEIYDALKGTTQGAGLIAAMAVPGVSYEQKQAMIEQVLDGTWAELVADYGPDVTLSEAIQKGYEQPVVAMLNAIALLAPAAKGASIIRFWRAGAPWREAYRLSRDPALAPELLGDKAPKRSIRRLNVKGKHTEPYSVELGQSRSAITRQGGRVTDLGSKALDWAAGGRAPVVGETARAIRAQRGQERRAGKRFQAEGAALWADVAKVIKDDPVQATRLVYNLQRPPDIPEEEWLRAALEDVKQMLAGREIQSREGVSATEKKLQVRIDRFKKKADAAAEARWTRRVEFIHDDHERALVSINTVNQEIAEGRALLKEALDNPDLDPLEKASLVEQIETHINIDIGRRKVLKETVKRLEVEQVPVVSTRRSEIMKTTNDLPNTTPDEVDDLFAVLDQRARTWARQEEGRDPGEWYTDPTGLGISEVKMIEHIADLPEGALKQIRFNLKRGITPEQVTQNLRYVKGGDLYKPHLGLQKNPKVFRTINGQRVQIIGRISPGEWVKRVLAVVPSQAERHELATWYREVAPTIERFFGPDAAAAEQVLRGFTVSQANASPASGLQATLRVIDKIKAGEEIAEDEISAVVKSIETAARGGYVSRGLAAKLHDFADSIEGKTTRTWMGDDPRGGRPTANDIHAIRDQGYVDKKLAARLRKPEDEALFKHGISGFQIDSGGSPSTHQYERMREHYEAITEHLNAMDEGRGFDGRNDWTPAEVQALGWSAIQRVHGATPENLVSAVASNTRRVNLEVTRGISGIGDDLSHAEAARVIEKVQGSIRELIEETDGLILDSDLEVGTSAYEGTSNASLHFNVIGSPEKTQKLITTLSDAFDQYDVWATRASSSTGSKPTLVIAHEALNDPEVALKLHAALRASSRRNKTRFAGFATTVDEDGLPAISLIMPGKAVTKKTHDARKAELEAEVDAAVHEVLGDVDYNVELHNTQILKKAEETDGTSELEAVQGGRAERALADPHSPEARLRQGLEDAVEATRAERQGRPEGVTPPDDVIPPGVMGQTRKDDLYGAVQFLETEPGKRILYLTQKADVSTLLHELIGHGTMEMSRSYPQEWAAVEEYVGRALHEWDTGDYERFATWVERFAANGKAPTPELVPAMRRLKRMYRVLYGGLREVGEPVPAAANRLFNTYFGAYNDENVYRITQAQARIEEVQRVSDAGTIFRLSEQELAAMRQRNAARAYNKSLDGMQRTIDKLTDRRDLGLLTPDEEEKLTVLQGEWMTLRAQQEAAHADRQTNLRARAAELEKALNSPGHPGYEGALTSMKALIDMREDILRSVFGEKYDSVFDNRVDLMADWLVDQGLLKPGFTRGKAYYVPHVPPTAKDPRRIDTPAQALQSTTVGFPDTAPLRMHRRNNLIRWQTGDFHADPIVVFEAWQSAQAYAFIYKLKEKMWDKGRPLLRDEMDALPKDVYVINKNGIPTPNLQRAKPGSADSEDTAHALDALDGQDAEKQGDLLVQYSRELFMSPADLAKHRKAGFKPNAVDLRVIDKHIVDGLFRPLRGGQHAIGTGWDLANTITRWSLIYTNPTYIPANLIGNMFFLGAQQPIHMIPNLIRAARIGLGDAKLRGRIEAETGEIAPVASVETGRGWQRVGAGEKKGLRWIGAVPDRFPRTAAWIYEARRMGYKTSEDMTRLLDGVDRHGRKSEQVERSRETVSERATEIMVNFERAGDAEKMVMNRALFIWPWIRGATAWPFYFAREFPVKAAVGANVAASAQDRKEKMLGPVSASSEGLFPVSTNGNLAQVMNVSSISPGGTAAESVNAVLAQIESFFSGVPPEPGSRIADYFNPVGQFGIAAVTGLNPWGQGISAQEAGKDLLANVIPQGHYAGQMLGLLDPSKKYVDNSRTQLTKRKLIRVGPEDVSIARLNAAAEQEGKKTVTEKINIAAADLLAKAKKLGYEDAHLPNNVRRSLKMKETYNEAREKFIDDAMNRSDYKKIKGRTLSPAQEAEFSYKFVLEHAPPLAKANGSPAGIDAENLDIYAQALLDGNKTYGIEGIFQPLTDFKAKMEKVKKAQGG